MAVDRPIPGSRAPTSTARGIAGFACLAALSGCAHYALPVGHLETPEARGTATEGPRIVGRIELGVESATDLVAAPGVTPPSADDPGGKTTYSAAGTLLPFFGFVGAVSDRIDLGVRFAPLAPLRARFKYQLSGEPETRASAGFAAAIALEPGFLLGRDAGATVTMFAFDASVPLGYRFSVRHLALLTPFFAFGSLSGASQTTAGLTARASGGTAPVAVASASASQYGAALGYQFAEEAFLLRVEVSYLLGGSTGDAKISGLGFGLLTGLRF